MENGDLLVETYKTMVGKLQKEERKARVITIVGWKSCPGRIWYEPDMPAGIWVSGTSEFESKEGPEKIFIPFSAIHRIEVMKL